MVKQNSDISRRQVLAQQQAAMRPKKIATKKSTRLQRIAADVQLGRNVKIFDFVNLYGCGIGDNTRIGTFVEIQKGAQVGLYCKISSHFFIRDGVGNLLGYCVV